MTRGCLEVLAEFRNPVTMLTKNHLVTRDLDHLSELASVNAARVFLSITTLDAKLAGIMEPRASRPELRLEAIAALTAAGVPAGVMVAPTIPGLTDHEMPAILEGARKAGARWAGFVVLRLPWTVAPLFEKWLEEHFPDRKERVLNRVRDLRGGKLYDSTWRARQRGDGIFAENIQAMFDISCRRHGLNQEEAVLSTSSFRRRTLQGSLFQ